MERVIPTTAAGCSVDQRQHLGAVCGRAHLLNCVCDPALFVDYVRNPAGKSGGFFVTRGVGQAHLSLGVAQERKSVTTLFSEGSVFLGRVEAATENLNVFFFEIADSVTESVSLERSTGGVRFRVEPKDDFLSSVVRQSDRRSIVRRDFEVRCLASWLEHLALPPLDQLSNAVGDHLEQRLRRDHGRSRLSQTSIRRERRNRRASYRSR